MKNFGEKGPKKRQLKWRVLSKNVTKFSKMSQKIAKNRCDTCDALFEKIEKMNFYFQKFQKSVTKWQKCHTSVTKVSHTSLTKMVCLKARKCAVCGFSRQFKDCKKWLFLAICDTVTLKNEK